MQIVILAEKLKASDLPVVARCRLEMRAGSTFMTILEEVSAPAEERERGIHGSATREDGVGPDRGRTRPCPSPPETPILAGAAGAVGTSAHLPERLRRALAIAFTARPPLRTVATLARATDCHRSTLARQWRKALGKKHPQRLQDLLAWIVLTQAIDLRVKRQSWRRITAELKVSERAIRTYAERLLGAKIQDPHTRLARLNGQIGTAAFLRPLLSPPTRSTRP